MPVSAASNADISGGVACEEVLAASSETTEAASWKASDSSVCGANGSACDGESGDPCATTASARATSRLLDLTSLSLPSSMRTFQRETPTEYSARVPWAPLNSGLSPRPTTSTRAPIGSGAAAGTGTGATEASPCGDNKLTRVRFCGGQVTEGKDSAWTAWALERLMGHPSSKCSLMQCKDTIAWQHGHATVSGACSDNWGCRLRGLSVAAIMAPPPRFS
mmetsp:Transcript_25096/g.69944  ORF Transcript_25096/g.69944 Transcript_25096/m.69944 type:complete len:220 (-) Transcript_25096:15-674(-)